MRILGIDLGSSSIKAVEMDSAFGRFDIHDYHEQALGPELTGTEAIAQLVKGLPKPPDRVIVSLPASASTFRNLQLPTKDKRAIQAGVGFELEDELPFQSEESNFEFAILSQTKQGSSVHVAATLNSHIEEAILSWEFASIQPDVITTVPWAFRTLLNHVLGPGPQENPVLLLQIGHAKTIAYLHWQKTPFFMREIPWGGRDLTAAISHKYDLPLDQAEAYKIDHGIIVSSTKEGSTTPSEVLDLSASLENSLNTLLNELRQVTLISRSITTKSIDFIYVSGGTSLLPGLNSWLEEKLSIPTKPLLALSSVTNSGVTYSGQTDARFLLATSLTLCLVGSERTHCINFRKGPYSKSGKSRSFNWEALQKPLLAVSIVSCCLILSLIVQSSVYQSRLASTDVDLEKSVRSFFGQISSSALRTYMANTSALRTSVNKELSKQREIARLFGPNSHSPIDYLNNLSTGIPKDVVVDLTQFQEGISPSDTYVGNDANASLALTFVVANPQVAERLSSFVERKVAGIQKGKMEEVTVAENLPKKWKVTYSGKPADGTFSK